MAEFTAKINAIDTVLRSFAIFHDKTEEERQKYLIELFPSNEQLLIYTTYPPEKLQHEKALLQEKKILELREQKFKFSPLVQVTTPSLTEVPETVKTMREHRRAGELAADRSFIKFLQSFYDENLVVSLEIKQIAAEIDSDLCSLLNGRDGFGFFKQLSQSESYSESVLSSVLTAHLSRLNNHQISFHHQLPWDPNEHNRGAMDVTALVKIPHPNRKGEVVTLPLLVIEAVATDGDKTKQLWSYINNQDAVFGPMPILALGIVWRLDRRKISISGYYKGIEQDEARNIVSECLYEVPLLKEQFYDPDSLAKILACVMSFIQEQIGRGCGMDVRNPRYAARIRNVYVDTDEQRVFKIFNSRVHGFSRSPEIGLKFLPECRMEVSCDKLDIISYKFIPGDHVPKVIAHVIEFLQQLLTLHLSDIVHGDIRSSNIIFPLLNSSSSDEPRVAIIDYDFSGIESKVYYPEDFNIAIEDGQRHHEVNGGVRIRKSHDTYAAAFILKQLRIVAEEKDETSPEEISSTWKRAVELVETGMLHEACETLKSVRNCRVDAIQRVVFPAPAAGTGSPENPQKMPFRNEKATAPSRSSSRRRSLIFEESKTEVTAIEQKEDFPGENAMHIEMINDPEVQEGNEEGPPHKRKKTHK